MRTLFLLTLAGLIIGLMGDVASGGVDLSTSNLVGAIVLSPLLVVVGGLAVGEGVVSELFLIGGLIFWPVWALLSWRWLKLRSAWVGALIVLWSAQGFFQLLHRLALVMSA